ncbi:MULTISPECIES: magnesium transporter CorA family protein [Acidithiobacillus]|uniref:Transporter n=1 Tax=Acidithiobacillus caldus (strain ATCC 51756 / DSM 8584 / KU) TaxID=637389 RepID=A0A059ZUA2_ACICK|nr:MULTISPECIES: magnesium transporter CorA family protein [Acidithiobacillus]AIA55175.1 transporter [Acidithiobacillus caldus ATCC 51756]MBU2729395.1 magnesium transporter CorA family protein [Acidithiobacillus caldus]MBU2735772.1 magnesium transporter CorA family protein [Acidithiobacillus caldus ATCC 51756]MBU2745401.1 magnesium transporter CorA family protein [Acidithiobacillus caldus]MBU2780674.1 magnesium transporter CorA family protein [Acidithiobacillus caldus]
MQERKHDGLDAGAEIPLSPDPTGKERRWLSISQPEPAELGRLGQQLGVDPGFLGDTLDRHERPSLHREGETTILLLRVPRISSAPPDPSWETVPLGILLQKWQLVTIETRHFGFLEQLRVRLGKRARRIRLREAMAELLQAIAQEYLRSLHQVKKGMDTVEHDLRASQNNDDFYRMVSLQNALTHFAASLRGNIGVLQRLLQMPVFRDDQEDLEDVADALVDLQQAREMAELYAATLTDLLDAYVGVLQNNIANRVKKLTAWTVVLAVSLMSTSLYGMNVPLPWQHWPYITPTLVGGGFLIAAAIYVYFRRHDWI